MSFEFFVKESEKKEFNKNRVKEEPMSDIKLCKSHTDKSELSVIEKSKNIEEKVEETEVKTAKAIIKDIEKTPKIKNSKVVNKAKMTRAQSCKSKIAGFFKGSRFAGIPLAIIYGIYVYYMISFLILSGPLNWNPTEMGKNETDVNRSNYR